MFRWLGVACRLHRVALGAGMLLCATLAWSLAEAENNANIDALKIVGDFDACVIRKGQDHGSCANEQWTTEVNKDGWLATGRAFDGLKPISEMSATCENGAYKGMADGHPWSAKCELTGDAAHPCFHITGGGPTQSFSKAVTRPCFAIAESTCTIELDGQFTGEVEPVKGEYELVLKELKGCRIVD